MSQNLTKLVLKYKLVFVGDQSVGKTSIINRFIYDDFTGTQQPTVGIDFVSKTLHIDNKTIRLQLWDTAGQERFRSLIPSYIRDSNAAIIVYDCTNSNSYTSVEKWIEYVRDERGEEVLIILVGNKCDANDQRQVTEQEAQKLAQQQKILFFESSAKEGINIIQIFKTIAQQLQNLDNPTQNNTDQLKIEEAKPSQAIHLTSTPNDKKDQSSNKTECC